jgi:hypothetical protein
MVLKQLILMVLEKLFRMQRDLDPDPPDTAIVPFFSQLFTSAARGQSSLARFLIKTDHWQSVEHS